MRFVSLFRHFGHPVEVDGSRTPHLPAEIIAITDRLLRGACLSVGKVERIVLCALPVVIADDGSVPSGSNPVCQAIDGVWAVSRWPDMGSYGDMNGCLPIRAAKIERFGLRLQGRDGNARIDTVQRFLLASFSLRVTLSYSKAVTPARGIICTKRYVCAKAVHELWRQRSS